VIVHLLNFCSEGLDSHMIFSFLLKKRLKTLLFISIISPAVLLFSYTDHVSREESQTEYLEVAGLSGASKVLGNGLRVVALNQPSSHKVLVELVFSGVGSAIDPLGKSGSAHFLEHMMFKGTPLLGENGYKSVCSKYGAWWNANTWFDYTTYVISVDKNNWKPFLHLYADVFKNASFNPQHLASEVSVVVAEMRRDLDDPFWTIQKEFVRTMVPAGHPQHGFFIGYKKDLASVRADDLKKMYTDYYDPALATLFLVGNVGNLDEAIASADKELSVLERKNAVLPQIYEKKYDLTIGFHKILQSDCSSDTILLGWPIPGGMNESASCFEMVEKLCNLRLAQRLVYDDGIAFNAVAKLRVFDGISYFAVIVNPRPGQSENCVTAIHEEIDKISRDGGVAEFSQIILKAELDHRLWLHSVAETGLSGGLNSTHDIALLRYVNSGNDLSYCFDNISKLKKVAPSSVQNVLNLYLKKELSSRVDNVPFTQDQRLNAFVELQKDQALEREIFQTHNRTDPLVEVDLPSDYPAVNNIDVTFPVPDSTVTLSNGLKIIIQKDTSSNLCSFKIAHRLQPDFLLSVDGLLVSILGRMLFQGTDTMTGKEMFDVFKKVGAKVSIDGGNLSVLCLKEHFNFLVEFVIKNISKPMYFQEVFNSVKASVLSELEGLKKDPFQCAIRARCQKMFPQELSDWSFDDAIKGLAAVGFKDFLAFQNYYLNPQFMVCSIVGNIESDEILALLEKTVEVTARPIAGYEFSRIPQADNSSNDIQMIKDQVWVLYGRKSPIRRSHKDYPAILLADQIVNKRSFALRDETGFFYTIWAGFMRSSGTVSLYDTVAAQAAPEKLSLVDECFKRFFSSDIRRPVTEQELQAAKTSLRSQWSYINSSLNDRVNYFVACEVNGLDFYKKTLDAIDSLTAEDVTRAIERYLAAGDFVRIRVGNISD